jgi:hypothetical protein
MTKRVTTPVLPRRIEKRPSPTQWGEDELLTLAEAAALLWPEGPLTTTSLRTAVRHGRLEVAEIAGKILTTKAALQRMAVCRRRTSPLDERPPSDFCPTGRIAEMQRRYLARFKDDA